MSGIKAAGPKRPWTAAEVEAVSRWQAEGVPHPEQARRLGRTVDSLRGGIVTHGLQGHPHKCAADLRAAVVRHLGAGLSLTAIAPLVGRNRWRVWQVVKEFERAGLVASNGRRGRWRRWVVTAKWRAEG